MPRRPRFPVPDQPTTDRTHTLLARQWPTSPGWHWTRDAIRQSIDRAKRVDSLAQAVYDTMWTVIQRYAPDWREHIREGLASLDRSPLDDGSDTYAAAYAGHRFVMQWLDDPNPDRGPQALAADVLMMQTLVRLSMIPGVGVRAGARRNVGGAGLPH